jgi:sulfate/thiosulfate transport system ATP-binding protein
LVTHDQDEALELANQIIVMHEGRIEQMGTPDEIYHQPATPFVAGFVGSANVLHGHVTDGHVEFGGHRVGGARHLEEGVAAQAFVRPHDVRLADPAVNGNSVIATVERVSSLGWLSRVILRLPDGQVLTAELPSEELAGIELGDDVRVDLRNAKAFRRGEAPAVGDLADSVIAGNDVGAT